MGATPFPGTLAQQVPQQQPQPAQPQGPQDMNAQLMKGSEDAQRMMAEQIMRVRALSDQSAALRQQQAALPIPQTGYQPNFQPMDSFGHVMGDIGKGLLLGLSATGPGQAIERAKYGPGIQQYKAKSGSLAKQIEEIQGQQEIEERPLAALSGAVWHPFQANASNIRAQSYAQSVNNRKEFNDKLMALDTSKMQEQERHNKQDEALMGMGVQVQRDRNNITLSLGDQSRTLKASEFDAAVNNKNQGIFDQIGQALGLKSFEGTGGPTQPVNAQAPAMGGGNKNKKKTGGQAGPPAGATHIGTSKKDGQDHYLDAQGNDLGLVNASAR